jgi:hypothetical protein
MFKITNRNDFPFTGRFNGIDYEFPVGEPVIIPDDAGVHIFAIGKWEKTEVLARHGWAKATDPREVGVAILNNFAFEHAHPTYDAPFAQVSHGPAPVVGDTGAADAADDAAAASVVEDAGDAEDVAVADDPVVYDIPPPGSVAAPMRRQRS